MTLPRPEDQLWIITDGALRDPGIGATLYVTGGDKSHVSVQRVHYWPTPSFGWPFDHSSHTTQPPIQLKMVVKCYLYAIDLDKAISCL